jgi:mevalonate kinase
MNILTNDFLNAIKRDILAMIAKAFSEYKQESSIDLIKKNQLAKELGISKPTLEKLTVELNLLTYTSERTTLYSRSDIQGKFYAKAI